MAGREQIRRARSAREITGARDLAGRVGAVSAPRAEIHHRSSARGGDHPRGLAREHALQMNLVQHKRLDKLGLDDWRDQLDRGFVRKNHGSFRRGPDISGETHSGQPPQELVGKLAQATQVTQILLVESKRFEELDHIGQPGGHDVGPARRKLAEEYLENRCARHSFGPVGLGHRHLVQVGEQRADVLADRHGCRLLLAR